MTDTKNHDQIWDSIESLRTEMRTEDENLNRRIDGIEKSIRDMQLKVVGAAFAGGALAQFLKDFIQ